jgi:dihydrofolate synthase/folylpolyglutamate synthase
MLPTLRSLPDLGTQPLGAISAADFTLERMVLLMEALGQPQQNYPSIHVAGTNGKGSVSALCASALHAAGLRVGLFTSPHLRGALQGISVDGAVVEERELELSFGSLGPHLVQRTDWTQFEVVTALAFQHFARAGVEAAVIEVGLGGRLDATNVLTPLVSVITPIDYDHTSILGNTLPEIAAEKAGIIKRGVPLVLAPQPAGVSEVIKKAAKGKTHVIEVGRDFCFEFAGFSLKGQDLKLWPASQAAQKTAVHISLLGAHQVVNAATAYAALQVAKGHGLPLDDVAIRSGFAAARWPGRFEVLQTKPALVLDAAHSPHAARALRRALDDYFPETLVTLVLGVSADKDLLGIIHPLRQRIGQVIATQSAHPRAMPAAELQSRLAALDLAVEARPAPAAALRRAFEIIGKGGMVLVAGSVFLVEQVREAFLSKSSE